MAAPIITLTSDFGLSDGYVASMKGVILGIAPDAGLVDISHLIPPQEVRSAALVLATCYECFPAGTVHLAVVDPGVGTERRAIAVRTRSGFFVGPDNGIFSLVLAKETGWEARSLESEELWRKPVSGTFHGRDIFAPVAAGIARGVAFELVGPVCFPAVLEWSSPVVGRTEVEGEIIHIDRFGNCITNVTKEHLNATGPLESWCLRAGGIEIPSILETYREGSAGRGARCRGKQRIHRDSGKSGQRRVAVGIAFGNKDIIFEGGLIFKLINLGPGFRRDDGSANSRPPAGNSGFFQQPARSSRG